MKQLLVRNVEEHLVRELKRRAAARGVAAEEEHRSILRRALMEAETPFPDLLGLLTSMPNVGEDDDFGRAQELPREVDLE